MVQTNDFVSIENISKKIRKTEIVSPLSFNLKQGKILALCGGNGAGKSTLIRMITGLIKPSTGTVRIDGYDQVKDQRNFFNTFGYMPDNFQFQPSIRAKETIKFYADLKKIGKHRIEEVIESVGLTDHMAKKMGAYSKGMTQRLLLAQAMLARPKLLVLDEPTNGLDPYWIQEFSELMKTAREQGQTIIFSTHELYVAEDIADEVIFLNEGKVISEGPIEQYQSAGLHETFRKLFISR